MRIAGGDAIGGLGIPSKLSLSGRFVHLLTARSGAANKREDQLFVRDVDIVLRDNDWHYFVKQKSRQQLVAVHFV